MSQSRSTPCKRGRDVIAVREVTNEYMRNINCETFIFQEMKMMKRTIAVILSMALAGSVTAARAQQGTTTATTAKSPLKKIVPKRSEPTVSPQFSEMQQAIDAQQLQIKQLSDLVQQLQ